MRDLADTDPTRRRAPAQARGRRRVEAILDAAADLLGEVGYDDLTLAAVAERSGSATGSLYHFFRNRDELIEALTERVRVDLLALLAEVFEHDLAALSTAAFVHTIVGATASFAARHPELPELMGRLLRSSAAVDAEIARRMDAVVRARSATLSNARRASAVTVMMEFVRAGVRLLARSPVSQRRMLQAEIERALVAYLTTLLGEGPS